MKVKLRALNKNYLVEFKSNEQMVSFLTEHGHKIQKFDIINEEALPAMEKHVELPKISKPTGWKTLEQSVISDMTSEKESDTKETTMGSKDNTFKYEPDRTLSSSVCEKSTDTPKSEDNENNKEDDKEDKEDKETVSESFKDYLPKGGFIRDDETDKSSKKIGIYGGQGTDEQIKKAKIIAKVKHANGDRMGRVTKEDLENFDEYYRQYKEIYGLEECGLSESDGDEYEHTHECSWCGEEFPESDMKCEKDMGWLCNKDWRYLESREGDLKECDPSEKNLDEGFKDRLQKAGKYAKNAIAGAAVAGSLMTSNPATAEISPDGTNSTDGYLQYQSDVEYEQPKIKYIDVLKAGKPITLDNNTYTVSELEALRKENGFSEKDMDDIINGIDPYHDGATKPF